MPHSQLARNGSGGGVVPRMDSTLGGLRMEADGGCEGREHFCALLCNAKVLLWLKGL
jgi:hypothetical protein